MFDSTKFLREHAYIHEVGLLYEELNCLYVLNKFKVSTFLKVFKCISVDTIIHQLEEFSREIIFCLDALVLVLKDVWR